MDLGRRARHLRIIAALAPVLPLLAMPQSASAAACGPTLSPLPAQTFQGFQDNRLQGVSFDSPTDGWAVGGDGTHIPVFAHWTGTGWTKVSGPYAGSTADIKALAAISTSDVWAAGANVFGATSSLFEHWNGATWTQSYLTGVGDTTALSAVSSTDVWGVGFREANRFAVHTPEAVHWNGASWTHVTTDPSVTEGAFQGVDTVSGVVWAVGATPSGALIERLKGGAWKQIPEPRAIAGDALTSVSAVSSSDVWAVGTRGGSSPRTLIEHWNGASWSVVPSPNPGTDADALTSIVTLGPTDAWAVGTKTSAGVARSLVLHLTPTGWTSVAAPALPDTSGLEGVTTTGDGGVVAVGHQFDAYDGVERTMIARADGGTWSVQDSPNTDIFGKPVYRGMDASSSTDAWAIGEGASGATLQHWDGIGWSSTPAPLTTFTTLTAVTDASPSLAWAVGRRFVPDSFQLRTQIERWDGVAWSLVDAPSLATASSAKAPSLLGVDADSPTDAWAVGNPALILHWNGAVWSRVPKAMLPSHAEFSNVVAISPSDVWVLGSAAGVPPFVIHWNGSSWTDSPLPALAGGARFRTLTAAGSHLFLGGSAISTGQPLIERWNGTSWKIVPTPTFTNPAEIDLFAAISGSDAFAFGSQGTSDQPQTFALRWDGKSWSAWGGAPTIAGYWQAAAASSAGRLWTGSYESNARIYQACGL